MILINGIEVGQSWALPAVLLLAYEASSRSSLKSWIAVSALDDPAPAQTPDEQERDRKRLRFRKCIGLLAGLAFVAAEVALILKGTPQMIDAFFSVIIGLVLTSSMFSMFSYAIQLPWVAYRTKVGGVIYRPLHNNWQAKGARMLLLVACGALAFVAMKKPNNLLIRLTSIASIVFAVSSRCSSKRMSIRRMTIFFVVYEAIVVAAVVGIIFAAYSTTGSKFNLKDLLHPPHLSSEEKAALSDALIGTNTASVLNNSAAMLIPAIYAAPVGQYLAALLRYDWHQARTSLATSGVVVLQQTEPYASRRCSRHAARTGPGLVVPNSISAWGNDVDMPFRVYHSLGMCLTLFVYLFLAPALHYGLTAYVFPSLSEAKYKPFEDQIFAVLAMFTVLPLLAIAIGIKAKLRGEKKMLWTYEESWTKTPAQMAAAAATAANAVVTATGTEQPAPPQYAAVADMEKLPIIYEDTPLIVTAEQDPEP